MPIGIKGFQKGHQNYLTKESGSKISRALKGKKKTEKHIENLRKAKNKTRFKKGQIAWNKGIPSKQETKKN